MTTIRLEQERFMEVAYDRTVRAAQRAFKSWHERKRADAIQECIAKQWDQWIRLVNRGRDPEPLLRGLTRYAILFVRYDRKVARKSPQLRRDGLPGRHEAATTQRQGQGQPDRSRQQGQRLDRLGGQGENRRPLGTRRRLEAVGVSLEEWVGAKA